MMVAFYPHVGTLKDKSTPPVDALQRQHPGGEWRRSGMRRLQIRSDSARGRAVVRVGVRRPRRPGRAADRRGGGDSMTPLESLFATIDALRAAEDRGSPTGGAGVGHPRCAV